MDTLICDFVRVRADEPDVARLLARHFELMRSQSPPESCHVLPGDALFSDDISVYALRNAGEAIAVGAIRRTGREGELKSMHTASTERGRGRARQLLRAMIAQARAEGIATLSLETGSGAEHAAARGLYLSEGFRECAPFGAYTADPLSVFMTRGI